MKIYIITLFPEIFPRVLSASILGRAQRKKLIEYELINLRDFGKGSHKIVDDRPYGGGVGMVLKVDVLAKAYSSIVNRQSSINKPYTILMSASGKTFVQKKARQLSKLGNLIIVCGHYEGVDQRFIDKYVDEEISIGDYVLTGGEIPAMVIIDALTRLVGGVLAKEEALKEESFENSLLEYPHYTRPEIFENMKVPEQLLSGNHKLIEILRRKLAIEKTKRFRPGLLKKVT